MNRYRFEAADATGKIESGHLEADSQSAAFSVLRGRGLTALLVSKESNVASHGGGGLFSANSRTTIWPGPRGNWRACWARVCRWKPR
jgi:type II secretory pathway component PulF